MNKRFLTIAMAAALAAPIAASAGDAPKVYGVVNLAITQAHSNNSDLDMESTTSAFGIKGSEDLGGGMKAFYKMEFQVDMLSRCNSTDVKLNTSIADGGNGDGVLDPNEVGQSGCDAIVDRDQYVGLKGGMGTVKIGTMSNNYKQKGGKIDPFYRTPLQARSNGQQSNLHSGAGNNGGRMTNTIQYASPKMGGMQLVFNKTVSGGDADETVGLGFRYDTKKISVWFDTLKASSSDRIFRQQGDRAMKLGVKAKLGGTTIGFQTEQIEQGAATDASVNFLSVKHSITKHDTIAFNYGETKDVFGGGDLSGFTLGVWHKMSKRTSTYVAYNDTSDEDTGDITGDDDTVALGIRHKF